MMTRSKKPGPKRREAPPSAPRQVRRERVGRLPDQGGAVGEEEHPLDPPGAHELVDEGDDRTGLARPGRHHEEGVALPAVECVADGADRPHLVRPAGDRGVDVGAAQRRPSLPPLDQQLQLVPGVEALHLARRVAGCVVPEPVLVAVWCRRSPGGGRTDASARRRIATPAAGRSAGSSWCAWPRRRPAAARHRPTGRRRRSRDPRCWASRRPRAPGRGPRPGASPPRSAARR